jgi:hypothetical protein
MVLSDGRLLELWDAQRDRIPLLQALELLAVAWPEQPAEQWANLSLGQRDEHLLTLHGAWFGGRFELAARCDRCGEVLELDFAAADIRAPAPDRPAAGEIEADGYRLRCRPPTSADLLAVSGLGLGESARRALLERCVEVVSPTPETGLAGELPEAVRAAAEAAMARADPQAEVSLAVSCPACGHGWSETFDVLAYLWDEIDQWAKRLLREIHVLAGAYGWSEADILALSPVRRRIYLELNGA